LRCGACGAYASPRFGGAYGCCAVCGHATSAAWGLPDGGRGRVDLPELDVYALEYVQRKRATERQQELKMVERETAA
jgi:hypothetical protein